MADSIPTGGAPAPTGNTTPSTTNHQLQVPKGAAAPKTVAPVAPPVETPAVEFWELPDEETGQSRKYTREEAAKLMATARRKQGFADKSVSQVREAMKLIQAKEAELARQSKLDKLDIDDLAKARGMTVKQFIQERVAREMQREQMTPEQLEIEQYRQERAEWEAQRASQQQAQMQAQTQARSNHFANQAVSQINDAFRRAGVTATGKERDTYMEAVQSVTQEFANAGLPFDAERIVELAREQVDGSVSKYAKSRLEHMDGHALLKEFGPKVVDKILRAQMEVVRGLKPGSTVAKPVQPSVQPKTEERKIQSLTELAEKRKALSDKWGTK